MLPFQYPVASAKVFLHCPYHRILVILEFPVLQLHPCKHEADITSVSLVKDMLFKRMLL